MRKKFFGQILRNDATLNAWFILWFIGFVIAWPRSAERGSLLTRRTDKRMYAHVYAPVHHQAEIADASSALKYVFKRCDPFLRSKSVCPQKRPPRADTCVRVRGPKMGSFRLQQNERASGRATGRDSMRQKGWSAPTTNSFLSKVAAVPTVVAISAFESQ